MIKYKRIESIEELLPILSEQGYRKDLDRHRSEFVYRGMLDADFRLDTSLHRNCKTLKKDLEPAILKNFTKYAALEDPTVERSVWHQMILGQHHGLPTRLMDWSQSPLIGLHFATNERDMDFTDKRDGAVWRIDMKELVGLLPDKYRMPLVTKSSVVFTVDGLAGITGSLKQYDEDMGDRAMAVIEPPSIDLRIVNQYAFFSVIPSGMDDVEKFLDENTENTVKYIIDKKLRWRVRDMLDQLNISERTVYPGLDGISKWLARHYFVKDEILK